MKYTLEKTSKATTCDEIIYHYVGDDGSKAAFHHHPTDAWSIVVVEGDGDIVEELYSVFVAHAIGQHMFSGGWDEAIAELEIADVGIDPYFSI